METSLSGMIVPIGTIVLIVLMQMSFWFPNMGSTNKKQRTNTNTSTSTSNADHTTTTGTTSTDNDTELKEMAGVDKKQEIINEQQSSCIIIPADQSSKNKTSNESNDNDVKDISTGSNYLDKESKNNNEEVENDDDEEDWLKNSNNNNNNNWRCACEFGFLPAGMLKTFGNAEAIAKLGIGQCYHKQS
jgi:FtsZ-interacting cell division protein ZipA